MKARFLLGLVLASWLAGFLPRLGAQEVFPSSYDMANGQGFRDDTYTGTTGDPATDGSPLAGGLGQLTDGKLGVDDVNADLGQGGGAEWVGWSSIHPVITFHFAASTAFSAVAFHTAGTGSRTFGAVQIEVSTDATFPVASTTVTHFYPTTAQRYDGTARYLFAPVSGTGQHVRVTLEDGFSEQILLSEVKFNVAGAVAAPQIAYAGGGTATQTAPVALTTSTSGAELRYTMDGTEPGPGSTLYSAPFRLSAAATVKARAFKSGWAASPVSALAVAIGERGTVLREYFASSDYTLDALAASPDYPDHPARQEWVSEMSSAPVLDYYGTRMRGYIYPPVTGSYHFRLSSDNQGAIYLSTDEDPANKTQIAFESYVSNGYSQISDAVTLQAGQRYYIEAVQAESTGGDDLYVGWDIPDDPTTTANEAAFEGPIPGSRLAPFDLATPRLSPDGGTFAASFTATLAEPLPPGITVTYTTDGSAPTSTSTAFPAAGLAISANTTVRLRAQNASGVASGISTAVYRLESTAPVNHEALELWLRADAGVSTDNGNVTQWLDQSGRGQHARQPSSANRPGFLSSALNSQPALDFDGSSQSLSLPAGFADFSQGLTAIVVARPTTAGNWQRFFDLGDNGAYHNIFFGRAEAAGDLFYQTYYYGTPTGALRARGSLAASTTQIFTLVQETSTRTSAYRDGELVGQDQVALPFNALRTRNFIGQSNFGGDALFTGQIAEVLIFRRALGATERASLEAWLATRYAPETIAAQPGISPAGGAFSGTATPAITLSTATSGASLRYTLDGTDPTETSLLYTAPFTLATGGVVKVRAFKTGTLPSRVAEASFNLAPSGVGFALAEYFESPERAVGDLTSAVSVYPGRPFAREYAAALSASLPRGYYGTRLRAYVCPPITGDYRFRLCSDDNGVLLLSPDDDPAHRKLIAFEPAVAGVGDYRQISALVPLQAGHRYYLEALQSGVGSPNGLAVGWEVPDDPATTTVNEATVEAPIVSAHLLPFSENDTPGQLAAIGLTPATGVFAGPVTVTLASAVPSGAVVRYTTDGSDPTSTSTAFPSAGLALSSDTTVRTRLFQGSAMSPPASESYRFDTAAGFSRAGVQLWLRADTGLETSANGSVSLWRDLSGHAAHATQGEAARQPQAVASSLNGHPAVRFDGVDDGLLGAANVEVGRPSTVFLVFKRGPGALGRLLQSGSGHNWLLGTYGSGGGGLYADGWVRAGENFVPGTPYVMAAVQGTDRSRLYVNGQDYTDDPSPTGVLGRVALGGALGTYSEPGSGDIAELLVFDHTLSDSDRLAVERYLGARYAAFSPQVEEPQITPPSGKASGSVQASISTLTPEAEIRYTLDGTTPTATSLLYTGPLTVSATTTVKARAFKASTAPSVVTEARYDFTTAAPIPLAHLALWLKADGPMSRGDDGRILRWGDLSGLGHDATMLESPRQPQWQANQLASLPVVHLDDAAQGLRVSPALQIGKPATIFHVYRIPTGASGERLLQSRTQNWLLGPYQSVFGFYAGGWVSPTNLPLAADLPHLSTAVQEPTRAAFFQDGAARTADPFPAAEVGQLVIGGPGAYSGYAGAEVAEVIVYDAVLSEADRFAVESYLAGRYGIATAVATPLLAPAGGLYNTATAPIALSTVTPGATIRYTTDGSDPTASSTAYTTPFTLSSSATVKAKAFKDGQADSTVASGTFAVNSGIQGGIARELFHGGNGSLASLYGSAEYPDHPFQRDVLSSISSSPNLDFYSTRLRGYLYPPVTGAYTFRLNADDNAKILLSTDESPAHVVELAYETSYATLGDYRQVSAPVNLMAGKRYYLEVVHSEIYGNDFVQVAWDIPDDPATTANEATTETPIPGSRLSPYGETDVPNELPAIGFSPAGGVFAGPVTVAVASPVPQGASVRYTLDGTDPTATSTLYTGPFTVSASATVKARQFRTGSDPSPITATVFTLDTASTFPRTNLAFWYRADLGATVDDSGRVQRLADQSGHATDATQLVALRRPLLAANAFGSQPGLRFDGVDDFLSTGTLVQPGARTLLFTAHFLRLDNTSGYGLLGTEGGSRTYLGIRSDGLPYYGIGDREGTFGSGPLNTTDTYVMTLVADGHGTARFYINNQLQGTVPYFSDSAANVAFTLGSLNTNWYANADVAEVLLFQTALNDEDRERTENYLANRAGAVRTIAAPAISPAGGTYAAAPTVTLTCTTPGATIRYTRDGTAPTASSPVYTAPLTVSATSQVRAQAFLGSRTSAAATADFTLEAAAAGVPHSGLALWLRGDRGLTFENGKVARWADQSGRGADATQTEASARPSLSTGSDGVLPGLSFDGTANFLSLPAGFDDFSQGFSAFIVAEPATATNYARFLEFSRGADQHLIAFGRKEATSSLIYDLLNPAANLARSEAANALETQVRQVFEVVQNPTGAVSLYKNGVLLSTNTGSLPATATRLVNSIGHSLYGGTAPFSGRLGEVLVYQRALSSAERGAVESYLQTRNGVQAYTAATPVLTPSSGFFTQPVSVTLGSATAGAAIRYTLDGGTPTESSTLYSGPFTLSSSAQVKARAFKSGLNTSSVSSGFFAIGDAAGAGDGVAAEYFDNADFTGSSVRRRETKIDFNYGSGSPAPTIAADTFSARFTGSLRPRFNEDFTFYTTSDDGVRLWIDLNRNGIFEASELVIDAFYDQSFVQHASAPLALLKGVDYPIKLEYYENAGAAGVTLAWSSFSTPQAVIPQSQLFSGLPNEVVSTPVLSPPPGLRGAGLAVSLSTATAGATIRYTLDNTDPTTENGSVYSTSLPVSEPTTIRARAFKTGAQTSGLALGSYTLDSAGPVISEVTFRGQPLADNTTLGGSGALGMTATDLSGISRAEFRVRPAAGGADTLIGADTNSANGLAVPWSNETLPDGDYLLTFTALDAFSQGTSVTRTVHLSLAARPPDLVASAVTVSPRPALSGGTITVTWQDGNTGSSAATGGWQDRVRILRAANGAVLLEALNYHDPAVEGTLAMGATLTRRQTFTLPEGSAGAGALQAEVTVDGGGSVAEFNTAGTAETNNTATAAFTSNLAAYPDLQVRNLAVAPAAVASGATLTVRWNTLNTGTAAAANTFADRLLVRNESNHETIFDSLVGGDTTGPLAPGATRARQATLTLPQGGRGSGVLSFTVTADASQTVAEFNAGDTGETNNEATLTRTAALAPAADLVVTSITAPAQALPGGTVEIVWTVKNQGQALAPAGWTDAIFLSDDAVLGNDRPLATSLATTPLAAGATVERRATVTLPSLPAGAKYVVIRTNVGGDSFEGDLTNNSALSATPLVIQAALALNLGRTAIDENSLAFPATVTRNGDASAALAVTLSATPSGSVILPASVSIPAGETSVTFSVAPVNDSQVNGPRALSLSASATGYTAANAPLTVVDDDVPALGLSLASSSVLENVGAAGTTGTVSRNTATTAPLTVSLVSSNTSAATVPASVVIPMGASSATFPITVYDDDVLTGTRTVRFTAAAAGLATTSVSLEVLDDDIPGLTLRVLPQAVAENAPAPAAFGRLVRDRTAPYEVVIRLASSLPASATVPAEVVLPAGAATVDFPITVLDNTVADGPRSVTLTATETDSVLHSPVPLQSATATLQVLDNEGATLSLSASASTVVTGQSTTGTISRAPGTTGAVSVSLTSSDAALSVPGSVTLADGVASTTFTITAASGATSSLPVTLTASATGLNSAALGLTVLASTQPDLTVTDVTPSATSAPGGSTVNVTWVVANDGSLPVRGTWVDRVFLTTDRQASGGTAAATVSITGPLATGVGYSRTAQITLPAAPGRYWVMVRTDAQDAITEGSETNNTLLAALPLDVQPAYHVTVATDVELASSGTDVPLRGQALRTGDDTPVAQALVSVRILVNGTRRVLTAYTDAQGNYLKVFRPLATEAGHYSVAAAQPDVTEDTVQDQFDLIGMSATPTGLTLRLAIQQPVSGEVQIQNLSDRPLSGLTATLQGAAANISGTLTPPTSLAAGGTGTLRYTLQAADASITQAKLAIRLTSTEGAVLSVPVDLTVLPLAAQLVANPGTLNRGMLRGVQTLVDCELVNLGAAPSGDLSVELPANFPWLRLATPAAIASLAPGEKTKITLQLLPAANLPLQLYTGNLFVRAAQSGLSIPFSFRAISEAAGDVTIHVLDDYTYYTAGAPRVEGATVKLRDPFDQSIVVAQGLTDATGSVTFPGVPESSYYLEVTAPKHGTYRNGFVVVPGIVNTQDVFLDRQTVTYTWQVVPTEIPDRYDIKLVATFEVDVPVPVVTMEATPTTLPDLQPGESMQVEVKLTNQGLIAAEQVSLNVPGLESGYEFIPLIRSLDSLAAKSTVTIPMIVRRPVAGVVSAALHGAPRFAGGGGGGGGGADCTAFVFTVYSYICGPDRRYHQAGVLFSAAGVVCGGGGGGVPFTPAVGRAEPGARSCSGPASPRMTIAPLAATFSWKAAADCLVGFIPGLGEGKDAFACGYGGTNCGNDLYKHFVKGEAFSGGSAYGCVRAGWDCLAAAGKVTPAAPVFGFIDCAVGFTQAALDCKERSEGKNLLATHTISRYQAVRTPRGFVTSSVATAASTDDRTAAVTEALARLNDQIDATSYAFGDRVWLSSQGDPAWGTWMDAFLAAIADTSEGGAQITATERTALLALPLPAGVTATQAGALLDRNNNTLSLNSRGIFTSDAAPADANFFALDVASARYLRAEESRLQSEAQGYATTTEGLVAALQQARDQPLKKTQGTCARVKIEIDQQAVLTRQAFSGTLEVTNSSQTSAIQDVGVVLDIRDANGNSANDRFFIRGPEVTGLADANGHGQLAAGATARLQFTFIPKHEAAPVADTVYNFAGTLQYSDNGLAVSLPMIPSPVTVHPDARLVLKYFHQRDVFSDDPFTPEIEPAEPFSLGLLVTNEGSGVAKAMKITSAQPKIIDNQKGLLIDFKIIGTQVGTQTVDPSLTVDLGDIEPGETQVAQFLLTSTLQGKFIDYQASFEHSSDLGGTATSLIDSVEIHELIHTVRDDRDGADALPDFLTNEVADPDSQPDTLYLSTGAVAVVNPATGAVATLGTLQGTLTANQPAGWSYLELPDPGAGLKLARVVRSDGKVLRVSDNVWQTDRSFPNALTGARREHLLHLLDFDGTGSYTLFYTPASGADTLSPYLAITSLGPVTPAVRTEPLETIDVTFSRPIDPASFTAEDVTLRRDDTAVSLAGQLTFTPLNETAWRIGGLAGFNAAEGTYVLTVQAATIADVTGRQGQGAASAVWALSTTHLAVVSAGGFGGSTLRGPVPAIDVTFSREINPATLTVAGLSLTRDGGAELLGSSTSIGKISGTTYRIGGLGALTAPSGSYAFTVRAATVQDTDGVAGVGVLTEHFTIDAAGPVLTALDEVVPALRNSAVSSLNLAFSKPILASSFTAANLTLTRNGKLVSLGSAHLIALDESHFRLAGLAEATGLAGQYALSIRATGVQDLLGNPGSGFTTRTWKVSIQKPAVPTRLAITPDRGFSATDRITNTTDIAITGQVAAGITRVRATDTTTGLALGEMTLAKTTFSFPVHFSLPGRHDLALQALDAAGNISAIAPLRVVLDLSRPHVALEAVTPTPRETPVATVPVTFSEALNAATFKRAALVLKRDGVPVVLGSGVTLVPASGGAYVVGGLAALTDKPGVYQLTVSAEGVQDLAGNAGEGSATVTWRRLPGNKLAQFGAYAGTYTGLLQADEPAHATSGILSAVLTRTGSFTGTATLGGIKVALRGTLDAEGHWNGVTTAGATAIRVSLTLVTTPGANALVGTVAGAAGTTSLVADRLLYSATHPTPLAGRYVVLLTAAPAGTAPGVPVGDGFAVLNLAPTGTITATGELADGTPFAQTTALGGEDEWPLYASLEGGRSSIIARVFFRPTENLSDLDGTLQWFRAARAGSSASSARLPLLGSTYTKPKSTDPAFDFGTPGQTAELVLTGGGLTSEVALPFTFNALGTAAFPTPGTLRPTLKLSLPDGRVTGTVLLPGDKTATALRGVVFPRQKAGSAYFLRLQNGGAVELRPKP